MNNKIIKNKYGFFELKNKPTKQELEKYYTKKYFQSDKEYKNKYEKFEKEYITNKISQKYSIIKKLITNKKRLSLLEIGSGEGWTLNFFYNKNWQVTGLDFSNSSCQNHNPKLLSKFITGDPQKNLIKIIEQKNKYDVIWLDNVLEHVLEPPKLLEQIKEVSTPKTILVIEVPNDFSYLQSYLFKNKYINKKHWVAYPDHISYFNQKGLNKLCQKTGWLNKYTISDWPIELDLLNPQTNYIKNPKVGKYSHQTRIKKENILHQISPTKTIELFKILADMNLGRQITSFFKLYK